MINLLLNIPVRTRIIGAAVILGLVMLLFTTPVISWFADLVSPPSAIKNITIIQQNDTVDISWDASKDIDISGYKLEIGVLDVELDASTTEYRTGVDSYPVDVDVVAVDSFGRTSVSNKITLEEPETLNQLNEYSTEVSRGVLSSQNIQIIVKSVVIAVGMVLLSSYIFGFIISSLKALTLLLYSAITLFPFSLLILSFQIAETNHLSKFVLSLVFSLGFGLVSYFVLLTSNILHTSLLKDIPLGQAGRAAQFIFSLLSAYIVLVLFFGVNFSFFEKLFLIAPFIFFVSFSSIYMLEHITLKQSIIRSLGITLTIAFAIFVLSIWPISYVYAILCVAICFYILLSISLEVRSQSTRYASVEYFILIALVSSLLLINSLWGINGPLL